MPRFEWDPSLETGDAMIDDQHRTLFALANRLADDFASEDAEEDTIEDAIYRLTDYVLEHFEAEESLMRSAGYPATGSHQGLHAQLAADTMRIAASHFNGDATASIRIGPFVAAWFRDHIEREDLRFATWRRTQHG